jgi:hypothetical protein
MIIESTIELKKYVSVAQSFVFDEFEPYINKAITTYIRKYVGDLHEQLNLIDAADSNKEIKLKAKDYLSAAIANFGMFLYFPLLQIQLDSSGASVPQNENRKSAEWWQIKDARRELLRSGHEAMDLLLEFLEKNPTVFTDYATNYSSLNNELIVNNAAVFSKYFNIFDSRQTFLALIPTISIVQDQYINTMICSELLTALKSETTGDVKLLKITLQKAIVAFTVAKVANNGLFILDDRGLRVDFENFSDGRREAIQNAKPVDQIQSLANDQIANGTQYLQLAKEIITANPTSFTQCEYPLKNSEIKGSGYSPYNTKGVFGL